jgi:hypothetical protein
MRGERKKGKMIYINEDEVIAGRSKRRGGG